MLLILCHAGDASAIRVYRQLVQRGFSSIHLLTAEDLAYALHWEHQLRTDGVAVRIELAQGLTLETSSIQGVLNRLRFVPTEHLAMAKFEDREYAAQELFSLFLSWLYSLPCPVLNRPTPQGLSGRELRFAEWLCLATQAGLRTTRYINAVDETWSPGQGISGWWTRLADGSERPFQLPTDALPSSSCIELIEPVSGRFYRVLVIGYRVVGSGLPEEVRESCHSLAVASQTALLGIDFVKSADGELTFWNATPFPNLRGGEVVLQALIEAFALEKGGGA